MEARENQDHTIADIEALPEGERAELIHGALYYMAAPSRRHQRLVTDIATAVNHYIKDNSGNCEVNVSPFAVFLNADDKTYVEPDIVVVCDSDKLTDEGCNGAPDWIIEVVSPSSRQMDYMRKLFLYRSAGVREYWIVDPDDLLITVYNFENETMEKYSFGQAVPAGIYEGFDIKVV